MQNGKWNLVVLGVFAIAIAVLGYKVCKAPKVAYINTPKLLEAIPEMQELQKKMKAEQEQAQSRVDTLTMDFEAKLKDHEKNLAHMSAKEKALSQELLRNKQNQLMQYQQAVGQKLQQQEQEKMGEVMKQVNTHIAAYGKAKGYTIILATSNGNIAYADDAIDVTAEVVKEMTSK